MEKETLKKASNVIRALNHKMRQEIIEMLKEKEMKVTDIYVALRIEQSVASQQLSILRKEGILITKRDGKNIYYSVNNERISNIMNLCEELTK
jgi:DNA-binding transcriptional ArsR family regulator